MSAEALVASPPITHRRSLFSRRMGEFRAAAVCRRGHPVSSDISKRGSDPFVDGLHQRPPESFCSVCGAAVLKECQDCGAPIKGRYHIDGVITGARYRPPNFCDNCSSPHPWATRQALIWEIENKIPQKALSASKRLELRETFEEIASGELSEDEQVKRWQSINPFLRKLPPEAWKTARKIIETVTSAYVKSKIGLD